MFYLYYYIWLILFYLINYINVLVYKIKLFCKWSNYASTSKIKFNELYLWEKIYLIYFYNHTLSNNKYLNLRDLSSILFFRKKQYPLIWIFFSKLESTCFTNEEIQFKNFKKIFFVIKKNNFLKFFIKFFFLEFFKIKKVSFIEIFFINFIVYSFFLKEIIIICRILKNTNINLKHNILLKFYENFFKNCLRQTFVKTLHKTNMITIFNNVFFKFYLKDDNFFKKWIKLNSPFKKTNKKINYFYEKFLYKNISTNLKLNFSIKFLPKNSNLLYNSINFNNNINILFLRKNNMFNKSRYSRNRQLYRTGVYWCIWVSIFLGYGLYFIFYRFTLIFSYHWWLIFVMLFSFILNRGVKYRFYNPIILLTFLHNSYMYMYELICALISINFFFFKNFFKFDNLFFTLIV